MNAAETETGTTAAEALTMLEALTTYPEQEVVARLADGRITLTGNFRGRELEVVRDWSPAGVR
jgi:hypothetical protein